MAKTNSLEDFIKTYVENKVKSESKESYENWLRQNGVDSYGIYSDAIRDANTDYRREKSSYGVNAEKLSSLGLSGAGYSDYIDGKAYSEMQRSKASARGTLAENEAKNRSEYGKYLEDKATWAKSDYEKAVKYITDANIMDYDEAYNYAVTAGLGEEDAALAAKTAGEAVRKRARAEVLSVIVNQRYNHKQAAEYARALGLSEEEAQELSSYADIINASGYYTKDYLDYLKKKLDGEESDE